MMEFVLLYSLMATMLQLTQVQLIPVEWVLVSYETPICVGDFDGILFGIDCR